MTTEASQGPEFYVTGGTLDPETPSYVERPADRDLLEQTLAGEFCWVLATRQMGKSSLMARVAERLQRQGIRTAIVDLSQIGTGTRSVTADQWYYGVGHSVLRGLGIGFDLGSWWEKRKRLPPVQRLTELFAEAVLKEVDGRIVIFVDEIDSTIGLGFSDDFFAAIRACYNARATDPAWRRLSFVLLGVAAPTELISDPTRTPFNVGRGIALDDFTLAEARSLARGLPVDQVQADRLLSRILYWTDGHPYLTQALCWATVDAKTGPTHEAEGDTTIDRLVEGSFLTEGAAREERNLQFVAARLSRSGPLARKLLRTYLRVRRGKKVADEPASSVHSALKLSGVVKRDEQGDLQVRNRIYERVFSPRWVKEEMPSDRNRWLVAAAVVASLAFFAIWYLTFLPREYIRNLETASQDVQVAQENYRRLRALPFFGDRADRLWALYWERRGDRDQALLARLAMLARRDSELTRSEAAQLVGPDYQNLLTTYRHAGSVGAVAFSPDGKTVLTGSGDNTARLWRVTDGQPIATLQHKDSVRAVAFSPDGKSLLTGSVDNTARLWRVTDGQPIATLQHKDSVRAVAFSPDGKSLLTGSDDNSARLWRADDGQPIALRHKGSVLAVAFSADGKTVLTGSQDNTAHLWRTDDGQPIATLRHQEWVRVVAFSPDGKTVLTGSDDNTARLWRASDGQPIATLHHRFWVSNVAFSPNGQVVVTGSFDGTARIWRATDGQPITTLQLLGPVLTLAVSPDGKTVLTGSGDNTARLWRITDGQPIATLFHQDPVRAVAFSPDGKTVLTGSGDNTARLWRITDGQPLATFQHQDSVRAVAFSPDGKSLLTGSPDNTARLWRTIDGQPLATLQHQLSVRAVAFSPDGKSLLTGSPDNTARLWRTTDGQPLATLQHQLSVRAVAFSPDGKSLLTGSNDNTARLWRATDGQPLATLQHKGSVQAVAFSPDGKSLLTGSDDNTARLWRATDGQLLATLQHKGSVRAVAFSPDGKSLLTGSVDNTARLWRADDGTLSEALQLQGSVVALAFTADGEGFFAATDHWVNYFRWTGTARPIASRILHGEWTDAYHFPGGCNACLQVALYTTGNSLFVTTLHFNSPDDPPIEGNPQILLDEWQKKLALQIDETGIITPRWPAPSVPNEPEIQKPRDP